MTRGGWSNVVEVSINGAASANEMELRLSRTCKGHFPRPADASFGEDKLCYVPPWGVAKGRYINFLNNNNNNYQANIVSKVFKP